MSARRTETGQTERAVATGSVYSTILIERVIGIAARDLAVERLVDVGCGDSPYRHVIGHADYVGVDRRPASNRGDVMIGDAASLPVASGIADGVLCTEVIEHVPDERALATELARIAAPGACLLLSAPFVHGLHEQPYDFRRLTSIGLVTTLEAAGWSVDSISSIGGPIVVSIDGIVRWADSLFRRAVRLIARRGSLAYRVLTSPSPFVQRRLARLALARGRHFGLIDPMAPSPRLTLGYVVTATRRSVAD